MSDIYVEPLHKPTKDIKGEEGAFDFSGSAPLLVASISKRLLRSDFTRKKKKRRKKQKKKKKHEPFGHFLADQTAKPICKRLDEGRTLNFINSQLTSNK